MFSLFHFMCHCEEQGDEAISWWQTAQVFGRLPRYTHGGDISVSMFVRLYDPSLSAVLFESSAGTSDSEISLKWNADQSRFQYTVGQNVVSTPIPEFLYVGRYKCNTFTEVSGIATIDSCMTACKVNSYCSDFMWKPYDANDANNRCMISEGKIGRAHV